MKLLIPLYLILISISSAHTFSQDADIKWIVEQLKTAVDSEDQTEKIYNKIMLMKTNSPTFLAYKGTVLVLKAKFSWNPISKLNYLNEGLTFINKAVATDSNNIEIRFIRFSTEYHLPSFLNKSKHLNSDIKIITSGLLEENGKSRYYVDLKDLAQGLIFSEKLSADVAKRIKVKYAIK